MNNSENNQSRGTVTVGAGTTTPRQVEIADFVQAEYADHRLISVVGLEDGHGSLLVSVENPASSGRATTNSMWLSRESLLGVLATALLYFSAKGEDVMALAEASAKDDKIHYSYSDNLGPVNLSPAQ